MAASPTMDHAALCHVLTGQYKRRGRGELCPVRRAPLYDCWGLVMALSALFVQSGQPVPDILAGQAHAKRDERHAIFERQLARGGWLRLDAPQPGAVVALRTDPRGRSFVDHAGVVVDANRFCHIQRDTAVHCDRLDMQPYARMIAGFYLWEGAA